MSTPPSVEVLPSRRIQLFKHLAFTAVFVLAMVAAAKALTPGLFVIMPAGLLVILFGLMFSLGRPRSPIGQGRLGILNDEVRVGALHLCERGAIVSAAVAPATREGTLVQIQRRSGGDLDLVVKDVAEGQEVLRRLGLDAAHATARFRVLDLDGTRWRRRVGWVIAAVALFAVSVPISAALRFPWMFLFLPLVVLGAISTAFTRVITVGADGIAGKRLFGHAFISFEGIVDAGVSEEPSGTARLTLVELLDAEGNVREQLLVDQKKQGPFQEGLQAEVDARAEALAERIREVLVVRNAAPRPMDRSALARDDRPVDEWVTRLRTLRDGKTTFRDAGPPTVDALLSIVEDVSSPAVERAAAAIALSKAPAEVKHRIRIAAESSAEPRLRVALEQAIDDRLEEIGVTLEELDRRANE